MTQKGFIPLRYFFRLPLCDKCVEGFYFNHQHIVTIVTLPVSVDPGLIITGHLIHLTLMFVSSSLCHSAATLQTQRLVIFTELC